MKGLNGPNIQIMTMVEKSFYHICTDGTKIDWLFKDDDDFIAGINRIGICVHITGTHLYSFVLMDNHVHFLIFGSLPECKHFINKYKQLTGRWIKQKYNLNGFVNKLPAQIIRLRSEEHILNVASYIDRNITRTSYPYLSSEYKWGSARYLFKDKHSVGGTKLSEYSKREQRVILNSHIELPLSWRVLSDGMLNPIDFVFYDKLEKLFKTPTRYNYFLAKKVEGVIDQELQNGRQTYIIDKELRPIVLNLSENIFGISDIRLLNIQNRLTLARKLRYEYYSTPKQISRMLGLPLDFLKGYI